MWIERVGLRVVLAAAFIGVMALWKLGATWIVDNSGFLGFAVTLGIIFSFGFWWERRYPTLPRQPAATQDEPPSSLPGARASGSAAPAERLD